MEECRPDNFPYAIFGKAAEWKGQATVAQQLHWSRPSTMHLLIESMLLIKPQHANDMTSSMKLFEKMLRVQLKFYLTIKISS